MSNHDRLSRNDRLNQYNLNPMHTIKPIHGFFLALIYALSLPIKLLAAQNIPWEIDIVPVLSRTVEYGSLPPVGTLSSVAAYNMPMLQWLHAPALWLTQDAGATILLTLLVFNWLGMVAVFWVGSAMFRPLAGLVAALLFAFSEIGISSSYTAWAQLLLPGFYAMTFACLWAWRWQERGIFLALAGIVATAAFMTHFSAVLLFPAMLVFALLTRAKWQIRWLLVGASVCLLMLAPYLRFEAERDFADVRAFLSQQARVDAEIMDVYGQYKPGAQPIPAANDSAPGADPTPAQTAQPQRDQNRIIAYAQRALRQSWNNALSPLTVGTGTLQSLAEPIAPLLALATPFFRLLVLGSVAVAILRYLPSARKQGIFSALVEREAGRALLIILFLGVIAAGFILTRSQGQMTYWTGFLSLEILLLAYLFSGMLGVVEKRPLPRFVVLAGWAVALAILTLLPPAERAARVLTHDDDAYSRYNVSLLRHVQAATDFIAADWAQSGDTALTVSYDIYPEMNNLWWVPAWNSVDPTYGMGMNFDFLLRLHHGLENRNADPIGFVEDFDYLVIYEPGLQRHDADPYDIQRFGAILVLTPRTP